MKKTLRILHLEDNRGDAEIVESMLAEADIGCELVRVDNRTDFQEALARGGFDLILSDYSLPDFDGAAALAVAREKHPQVPFIFVSGALGEELAIESLKSGATDYVLKHRLSRLVPAVQRALQEAEERSNRRLLEEQLRQAQKVEAIGQLAGGVAHDFNNILTAITAYSEGMIKQLPPNHQLHKSALEINKAAARAASLTRQLLVFSRKQVLQPKVVDLNALVADVEKMLGRVIGENIQLNCQLGSALGHVKADPGHLQQVIMNLAVNARDAMPNGGTLTIQTANAAVDETYARQHVGLTAGDYVTLTVTDTGTGMTEQVKAHLFEPFFTTKGEGKGTGLGLATCFGIVQQSGGAISVQSQVGQGTTFRIYLPRVQAVAESLPKRVEFSDLPTGDETVLLVEDEPVVREVASAALRDLGYSVLEASNGEEALNMVQKQDGRDIHLLLTDMVMPVMGGKELADWLRGAYPQVKVLFTSGYTEDALRDQGVPHADLALLEKPFTSVTLANKVRQVLDKGA